MAGVSLAFLAPRDAIITLSAAPAGHISPEGEIHQALGSQLTVTVWSDDRDMTPWLMIGAHGVQPTAADNGHYTYAFTVTGNTGVQASFIELADNVRVLPQGFGSRIVSVSAAQDEVVVAGGLDFVSDLAVDDILANTAASGYDGRLTVRILRITRDGDRTILRTEPVPFTDAIVKASIHADIPLQFAADATGQPTSLIGPSVVRAGDIASGGFSLDLTRTFEQAGSNGKAKAVVGGNITLNASLELNLVIEPKACLCWPPLQGEVRLFELVLAESASASASLNAEAQAHLAQAATLLKKGFPGIAISVLYVEPKVELGLGVDVSAGGSLNVKASAQEQLRVGIRLRDGQWSPIQDFQASTAGSIDVSGTAKARVYPTFRLGATIDWACTPYLEFQPGFFELQADIHANPWWKLDAGITGTGGIDCDLIVTKLHWQMDEHEMSRMRVKDAGGPLTATVSSPTPRASTPSPPPATAIPTATSDSSLAANGVVVTTFPDTTPALSVVPDERWFEVARFKNQRPDAAVLLVPEYDFRDAAGRRLDITFVSAFDSQAAGLLVLPADQGFDVLRITDRRVASVRVTFRSLRWLSAPGPALLSYRSFSQDCRYAESPHLFLGCTWYNAGTYPIIVRGGAIIGLSQPKGDRVTILITDMPDWGPLTTIPAGGSAFVASSASASERWLQFSSGQVPDGYGPWMFPTLELPTNQPALVPPRFLP